MAPTLFIIFFSLLVSLLLALSHIFLCLQIVWPWRHILLRLIVSHKYVTSMGLFHRKPIVIGGAWQIRPSFLACSQLSSLPTMNLPVLLDGTCRTLWRWDWVMHGHLNIVCLLLVFWYILLTFSLCCSCQRYLHHHPPSPGDVLRKRSWCLWEGHLWSASKMWMKIGCVTQCSLRLVNILRPRFDITCAH